MGKKQEKLHKELLLEFHHLATILFLVGVVVTLAWVFLETRQRVDLLVRLITTKEVIAPVTYRVAKKVVSRSQTSVSLPPSSGHVRLIRGEPPHFTGADLADWEKEFLLYSQSGKLRARYFNGSVYAINIPTDVYLYMREASVASGVPIEIPLAVCWTEGPSLRRANARSSAGAGGICQVMPGTFNASKHSPNANRFNKRDNIYAAVNYMIRIGLTDASDREKFARKFAMPPVWNMHWGQAYAAYDAAVTIRDAMARFRK